MQQQSPASPHLDDVAQRCPFDHLAHRGAAEHQTFHAEKPRIRGKLDAQMAAHGAAIEQDGLLRQPLGRAALATAIRVRTLDAALPGSAR